MSASSAPVIVLAHGSRHPLADQAIHQVADAVGAEAAFLDFSPRTLENQARLLAAQGHKDISVLPLLFTDAFHARHDVPETVAETERALGVNITVTDSLGTGEDIAELLVNRVQQAQAYQRFTNIVIYAVGSSNSEANQAVADLAHSVGQRLRMPCAALFATGRGRGVAALSAHCAEHGPTHVVPLFAAPGTLWDMAVESRIPNASFGTPLGAELAGVIEHRLHQVKGLESR